MTGARDPGQDKVNGYPRSPLKETKTKVQVVRSTPYRLNSTILHPSTLQFGIAVSSSARERDHVRDAHPSISSPSALPPQPTHLLFALPTDTRANGFISTECTRCKRCRLQRPALDILPNSVQYDVLFSGQQGRRSRKLPEQPRILQLDIFQHWKRASESLYPAAAKAAAANSLTPIHLSQAVILRVRAAVPIQPPYQPNIQSIGSGPTTWRWSGLSLQVAGLVTRGETPRTLPQPRQAQPRH